MWEIVDYSVVHYSLWRIWFNFGRSTTPRPHSNSANVWRGGGNWKFDVKHKSFEDISRSPGRKKKYPFIFKRTRFLIGNIEGFRERKQFPCFWEEQGNFFLFSEPSLLKLIQCLDNQETTSLLFFAPKNDLEVNDKISFIKRK